jgi:uncharacterized membrane protein
MDFPQRATRFSATDSGFRVVLKRNCSISPRGLLLVFALLAALALGIASVFAALGAWLILPFAVFVLFTVRMILPLLSRFCSIIYN